MVCRPSGTLLQWHRQKVTTEHVTTEAGMLGSWEVTPSVPLEQREVPEHVEGRCLTVRLCQLVYSEKWVVSAVLTALAGLYIGA